MKKAAIVLTLICIFLFASCSKKTTEINRAVENLNVEKVKTLLDKTPALAKKEDGAGWTPLHAAAAIGHQKVLGKVVLQGKKVPAPSDEQKKKAVQITEILIEKSALVNTETNAGWTPLQLACGRGMDGVALLLIKHGANINKADKTGKRSPLRMAIKSQSQAIVKALIEKGAKVNAADTVQGRTPLILAAERGGPEIVKMLTDAGANVNAADRLHNESALHKAAKNRKVEAVRILLKNKADPNAQNKQGETPLHLVCGVGPDRGEAEIAEVLVKNGAKVNTRNKRGATPLGTANAYQKNKLVELLRKHGGKE